MVTFLLKIFVKDYQDTNNLKVREKYGLLGSFFGLITNFLLFFSKIVIGIMLGLFSIVTDSVNNLSDFGNNFISIFGVKASNKKADKEHPYGHQRVEYILSLIISCVIIGLSMVMMYQSIGDLVIFIRCIADTGCPPKKEFSYVMYVVSLSLMSAGIFVKFVQSYLYFSLGRRIDSMPLRALGKDARNDVITTFFVIIGIIITWFSSYDVDCFFTMVVAIFVCLSGIGIMKESVSTLIGQEPDHAVVRKMIWIIRKYDGVLGIHDLSMHYYGKAVFAVIHVEVSGDVDVNRSHEMIDQIEKEVYSELGINLTIHMDPIDTHDPLANEVRKIIVDELKKMSEEKIMMHDFHLFDEYNRKIVEFELILPETMDDEEHKTKIEDDMKKILQSVIKKDFEVRVGFDSKVQDFLADVEEE